jgi:hypothetical protein
MAIVPKIPVVGDIPRRLRQFNPDRLLAVAHMIISKVLERTNVVHTDDSPDKIESTVSVDPKSIFNAFFSAFLALLVDCCEKVAIQI